jgi:hypothetical protein
MSRVSTFYNVIDGDDYQEFIKGTIKLFRMSHEYKMWLTMTNNEQCAVTNLSRDSVEIQVHHFGHTLWDIVEEIINYFIQSDVPYNSFYICQILTDLHFNGCISYIPLEHCIHNMLHKDPNLCRSLYPNLDSLVTYGDQDTKIEIIEYWKNKLQSLQ